MKNWKCWPQGVEEKLRALGLWLNGKSDNVDDWSDEDWERLRDCLSRARAACDEELKKIEGET